jgi:hypothetical protein
MFGRRSHVRFTFSRSPNGLLRILRDVIVQPADGGAFVAISQEAAAVGESLRLDLGEWDLSRVEVRVVECSPVIVDGSVRHRMRLERILPGDGSAPNGF